MPKKKSPQDQLIAMSGAQLPVKEKQSTSETPSAFMRTMCNHPDPKAAAQLVEYHSGAEFDKDEGAALESLQLLQDDINQQYTVSEQKSAALEDTLTNTKQYVKVARDPDQADKPINFLGWKIGDQITFGMLSITLLTVMGIGCVNIYTNLMASGEPVFLEQPWLAMCLSLLAPAGSMAFKFISHFFDYETTKKRYALLIYSLTVIVMLAWSIAFALNFTGVTGGFDLDVMMESDGGKGALLVWLQLAAEILIAGALFLALGEIAHRYSPDLYQENLAYINAEKALEKHRDAHASLSQKRADHFTKLTALENKRKLHIAERLAQFHELRRKLN